MKLVRQLKPTFRTLLILEFLEAFAKGCFESQLNPDIIQLVYIRMKKEDIYAANAHFIDAVILLAQLVGEIIGSGVLPLVRTYLTYKKASMIFLSLFVLFQGMMVVPINEKYIFSLMLLNGVTMSIYSQIILIWIGEVAEPRYRGILGVMYEVSIGVGNMGNALFLLLVNYYYRMHVPELNLYYVNFVPGLASSLICLLFEIPIEDSVGKLEDGIEEPLEAVTEIAVQQIENGRSVPKKTVVEASYKQILCERKYRKALALAIFIGIWQESTGICGICNFATVIFAHYFSTPLSSAIGSLVVMTGKTLGSFPVVFLIERMGRKMLILIGSIGCCLGLIFLIIGYAADISKVASDVLLLTGVITYLCGFAVGGGPCCHVLNSEIYPRICKGKLSGIGMVLFFITYGLVVGLFEVSSPEGQEYIVYSCYLTCIVVFTTVVLLILPETKGKSNSQVEAAVLLK